MKKTSISSFDLTILWFDVATLMSTSLQSGSAASSFLVFQLIVIGTTVIVIGTAIGTNTVFDINFTVRLLNK